MSPDLDVAVVGAGPAGLATAYALQRAGRSVHVFEAADAVGGRMRTLRHDGYLIDTGAEIIGTGFKATWRLIRELGVPTADVSRIASPFGMWRNGRGGPVGHPLRLIPGADLSLRSRLDLLRLTVSLVRWSRVFDPDHPERTPLGDMTIAQLAARYHRQLSDYFFQPFAAGFAGSDIERSAAAPFINNLLLVRGRMNRWTYREGMDTLARRLAERLDVTTGYQVQQVTSAPGSARVVADGGVFTARSVVLCVPAPVALDLYPNVPEDERRYLQACTYAPALKVVCALDRPLAPPGDPPVVLLIIPAVENPTLTQLTIDHIREPGRAPEGRGLVSLYPCPLATPTLIDSPDDEVVRCLTEQAEQYLPGLRQATSATFVYRFRHGIPEATPAALRLRSDFLRRPTRTVDYGGDWLMLLPNSEGAIRSADLAAWRVLSRTDSDLRHAAGQGV